MENNTSGRNSLDAIYARIIKEANRSCYADVLSQPYPSDGELYCNATFDGYSCWNYTRAGTRTYGTCPQFFHNSFGHANALPFKDCNIDGTWYRHPKSNQSWSDYTPCTVTANAKRLQTVINIYFGGYSLSLIFLIMALFIFCFYRQLKCPRVSIHKNMFVSYILADVFWVIYYTATSQHPQVLLDNPLWCRLLHVFAQYATCSNYSWMFCEGLYLHTILIRVFVNESNIVTICYVVGWVIPFIQTIIYFTLRLLLQLDNTLCWHGQSDLHWIFLAPIILELCMNTMFLVNVLRILCRKRISTNPPDTLPVRTLKATVILVPLLGIQYLAVPYRPDGEEELTHIYNVFSAVLVSFQGFVVALLFCFFNEEVIFLLKKQFVSHCQHKLTRADTVRTTLHSLIPNSARLGNTRMSSGKTRLSNSNSEMKEDSDEDVRVPEETKEPKESDKDCITVATSGI